MILEYDDHDEAVAFILCLGLGNVGRTKLAVVSASKAFSQSVLDDAMAEWDLVDGDDDEYIDDKAFGPDPIALEKFGPDVLVFLAPDEIDPHYKASMIANMNRGGK